jgi:putative membrane protein
MKFISNLLTNSLAVVVGAYLLSGIEINESFWNIIVVALVIGILNSIVKPLLIILTIPITLVTFGLFLVVINGLIILLADQLLDGFAVKNFWWALLFSLVISLVNSFIGNFDQNKPQNKSY